MHLVDAFIQSDLNCIYICKYILLFLCNQTCGIDVAIASVHLKKSLDGID